MAPIESYSQNYMKQIVVNEPLSSTSTMFSCVINAVKNVFFFLNVFQNHQHLPKKAFSRTLKSNISLFKPDIPSQHGSKMPIDLPPPGCCDGFIQSWAREENPTASTTDSVVPQGKQRQLARRGAPCGFQSRLQRQCSCQLPLLGEPGFSRQHTGPASGCKRPSQH